MGTVMWGWAGGGSWKEPGGWHGVPWVLGAMSQTCPHAVTVPRPGGCRPHPCPHPCSPPTPCPHPQGGPNPTLSPSPRPCPLSPCLGGPHPHPHIPTLPPCPGGSCVPPPPHPVSLSPPCLPPLPMWSNSMGVQSSPGGQGQWYTAPPWVTLGWLVLALGAPTRMLTLVGGRVGCSGRGGLSPEGHSGRHPRRESPAGGCPAGGMTPLLRSPPPALPGPPGPSDSALKPPTAVDGVEGSHAPRRGGGTQGWPGPGGRHRGVPPSLSRGAWVPPE